MCAIEGCERPRFTQYEQAPHGYDRARRYCQQCAILIDALKRIHNEKHGISEPLRMSDYYYDEHGRLHRK